MTRVFALWPGISFSSATVSAEGRTCGPSLSNNAVALERVQFSLRQAQHAAQDLVVVRPHRWTGPIRAARRGAELRHKGRDLEGFAVDLDLLKQTAGVKMRVTHHVRHAVYGTRRHRRRLQPLQHLHGIERS